MIEFYFNGGGRKLQLPVSPEKLTITRAGNNQRTEVVLLGEINILRNAKLAAVSFDFLLPGADYYPFVSAWNSPEEITEYFDTLLNDGKSARFTVTDCDIAMRVSVENFSYVREAGDHESLKCSISLLEYRSYGAKVLAVPQATPTARVAAAASTRPVDKPQSKTYTVKPGDSFWRIAQQQLGDGSRFNEVATVNGMTIATVIHAGNVLKLPAR